MKVLSSNYYIHSFVQDPNRSFGITGCGFNHLGLRKGATFQVKYRGVVCQIADWAGYVPGLGIAVGVARIALSVFALIGCAVSSVSIRFVFVCSDPNTCCDEMLQKVDIIAQRALHEFFRGIGEIIQPINWIMEAVTISDAENKYGTMNSIRPTGPVYYINKDGLVVYPWKEYDTFNTKYDQALGSLATIHPSIRLPVAPGNASPVVAQPVASAPLGSSVYSTDGSVCS